METTLTLTKTLSTTATTTATTTAILSLLHIRRLTTSPSPPPPRFLLTRRLSSAVTLSLLSSPRLLRPHLRPLSRSSASFVAGYGGGSGGLGGGDGGGSGDGFGSGVPKVAAVDDAASISPDAIVLDVGGMTCGGCAAKVKKILENQPQVSSATVNLATETAIVLPATEAKVVPNWRQELGELLAKHLTNCGFESNPRGHGDNEGEIPL